MSEENENKSENMELEKTKKKENNKETKKEKKNKKEEYKALVSELHEKNKRLLADMENLRRRSDEERADNIKYRAQGFIIEILPTIDMFESALKQKNVSDEVKNWLIGFEMILNNFKQVLKNEGVEKIEVKIGDDFDHNIHYAIEEEITDEIEPGKILKVKQDGYMLRGRLLRATSVVIAKANEENEETVDSNKEKAN